MLSRLCFFFALALLLTLSNVLVVKAIDDEDTAELLRQMRSTNSTKSPKVMFYALVIVTTIFKAASLTIPFSLSANKQSKPWRIWWKNRNKRSRTTTLARTKWAVLTTGIWSQGKSKLRIFSLCSKVTWAMRWAIIHIGKWNLFFTWIFTF